MFSGLNVITYSFGFFRFRMYMASQELDIVTNVSSDHLPSDTDDNESFCKITTKWLYHSLHGILWTLWWMLPFSVLPLNVSHTCLFPISLKSSGLCSEVPLVSPARQGKFIQQPQACLLPLHSHAPSERQPYRHWENNALLSFLVPS